MIRCAGSAGILCLIFAIASVAPAQVNRDQVKRIDAAVPEKARVEPKKERRLLIWNTPFMDKSPHKGYTIPQAEYAFRLMGERTGAYTPVVSDDVAILLPERLKQFDAILLNNANGQWIRPTEADMKKFDPDKHGATIDAVEQYLRESLLDWVRAGHGVMAYHHAIGGNTHWPEFLELIGAGYWGHPWNEEVGIKVEEPNHPVLAAFKGKKSFRLWDEIFQFREPYARDKVRVLLSLDVENTNMGVQWINRKDNDFALAWVKSYGEGRVFYTAIGHRTDIWWNQMLLKFYLDGIQFALGDLEAPIEPRQK